MDKTANPGSEITVRVSIAFQEEPEIHTLLAMTPVRDRGKLVRLALSRYISETDHPAGNVDEQISAISKWLRDRSKCIKGGALPSAFQPDDLVPVGRALKAEAIERKEKHEFASSDVRKESTIQQGGKTISRWLSEP